MLADQAEALLIFCRRRVFHPEQMVILDFFTQTRRLDRRQTVMYVMEQMNVEAKFFTHGSKKLGNVIQIFFRRPGLFFRPALGCRLIGSALGNAIDRLHARNTTLDADRLEALFFIFCKSIQCFRNIPSGGMTVGDHMLARSAAQQLINRKIGNLAFDVPQRHVDRADCRHRHWPAPPVSPPIEILPGILDLMRITADQQRADMILEVGSNGKLTSVERRIAQSGHAIIGCQFQRNEVAPWATNDDFSFGNFHWISFRACQSKK